MKPAHIPPTTTLSADATPITTNIFLIKTEFASSLFLTSHHSSQDKVIVFLQVSFLQQLVEGPPTTRETSEVTQIAEASAYLNLPPVAPEEGRLSSASAEETQQPSAGTVPVCPLLQTETAQPV